MSVRRMLPVSVGLAAVLVLAGCGSSGGSKSVSATSYVHTVCTAALSTQNNLKGGESSLTTTLGSQVSSGNLSGAKSTLLTFLNQAIGQLTSLRSKIAGAGTPNVANGGQVRATLLSALNGLISQFTSARNQVAGLSTSNSQQFATALQSVGNQLTNAGNSFNSRLTSSSGLTAGPLSSAFQADSTCQQLNSSSSSGG